MRQVRLALCLVFSLLFTSTNYASTIYVNIEATGNNTGKNWTDAYISLTDALENALAGDQIWVAAGKYTPKIDDRVATFLIKNGVAIYGGFAGTETNLTARNTIANTTTLSGERGNPAYSTDNHYNVLRMYDVDSTTLLDGLTIQDGYAFNDSLVPFNHYSLKGGGLYVTTTVENTSSNPMIQNCIFQNNQGGEGGAIFLAGTLNTWTNPSIKDCTFYLNRARRGGGAINQHYGNRLGGIFKIVRCIFDENTSDRLSGGAILAHWTTGNILVDNCHFTNNNGIQGGAINYEADDGTGNLIIKQSTFSENESIGGVIYYQANGVSLRDSSIHEITIQKSTFKDNQSTNGTVEISTRKSKITLNLIDSKFENNYSRSSSILHFQNSGFNTTQGILLINRCIFRRNESNIGNFPIQISNSSDKPNDSFKGAIYNSIFDQNTGIASFLDKDYRDDPLLSFVNCTFHQNTSKNVLFHQRNSVTPELSSVNNPISFTNCIFDEDVQSISDIFYNGNNDGAHADFGYSINHSWFSLDTITDEALSPYFKNVLYNKAPLFVDTSNSNFSLIPCSPAVNAGTTEDLDEKLLSGDIFGSERLQHGSIDMGAVEKDQIDIRPIIKVTLPSTLLTLDGSLEVTSVIGGNPPYQYEWSNGIKSETNVNLLIGDYELMITDVNGCQGVVTKNLSLLIDSLQLSILPMDTCLTDSANNCKANPTFTANLEAGNCPNVKITWSIAAEGNILAEGDGSSFNFEVDLETAYEVTFTAMDSFGNGAIAMDIFTFSDCQAPVLEIKNLVSRNWEGNDFNFLSTTDFITHLSDNCTDSSNIIQKIIWGDLVVPNSLEEIVSLPDTLQFLCRYLGNIRIKVIAVDAANNKTIIETNIVIQNLTDLCMPSIANYLFSGKVIDDYGQNVVGATAKITSEPTNVDFITNENGDYQIFLEIGTTTPTYEITVAKEDDPLNGVTTFDIILIRQHIINKRPFDSPFQYLAADINGSQTITTIDIVLLYKLILGIDTHFPDGQSWIFLQNGYAFQSDNPLTEDYPTSHTVLSSSTGVNFDGLDFEGIKKGDLNNSAKVDEFATAEARNNATLFLTTADQFLQEGKTYTVPFSFSEDQPLSGYQLSIQTKDLILKEINGKIIETGTFASDNFYSWLSKDKHQINLNWLPEEVDNGQFNLTFTANKTGYLSELLVLNQRIFVNEGYTTELETMDLMLDFLPTESPYNPLAATLSPNPIRLNQTMLTIENSQPTTLWINIYNAQGQVVQSAQEQIAAGEYQRKLTVPNIVGTYWVHLTTGNGELRQFKLVKL